jgi:murein DD-endopeptidase MepM/ murein hydrolase activator NlpD
MALLQIIRSGTRAVRSTRWAILGALSRSKVSPGTGRVHRTKIWLLGIAVSATSVTLASIPLPPANSVAAGLSPRLHLTSFSEVTDTIRFVSRWGLSTASSLDSEQLTRSLRRVFGANVPAGKQALPPRRSAALNRGFLRADAMGYLQEPVRSKPEQRQDQGLRLTQLMHSNIPFGETSHNAVEVRQAYVSGRIQRSLFEDGEDAGLSDPLILGLVQIFGWDVDFALDVSPGDRFVVIHEEKYWQGRKIADGEILAAEFVNRGHTYRAIGFRNAEGKMAYYSVTGRNMRRAFLRTPVKFTRVSSLFAKARYHPVLKIWRAHNGVDYVAPVGTPVHATASGRVVWRGRQGSYGNTIVIDHGGTYSTVYAHLSRYRTGLRAGEYVKQGAVIGYIGSTGLATGPHLHYELRVNGWHQNPLTFEFPTGEPIPAELRREFLRTARAWISNLDLISGRAVATVSRPAVPIP